MTPRRVGWRAGLAFAVALGLACGARPPPKQAEEEEQRRIILATEYDDQRAGTEASEHIAAELGVYEDEGLLEYVRAVGRRLVRHAPRRRFEYRFQIVDQEVPNAFALPGGFIYVSRGLLALANSEDELANVLGHEIIHVASRHAAARQGIELPGILQIFQIPHIAAYSRDQERTADRLGQGLAALAGYDPSALATFLHSMEMVERLKLGASRGAGFLDTHPATGERLASASTRAGMVSWARLEGVAADHAAFLGRLDGLPVGQSAAGGVFDGSRFLHPEMGFTMRFPDGWQTHNLPRAVGAISPKRDAQVFLEHHGEGSDPREAAREYLEELEPLGVRIREGAPVKIGSLPGYRMVGTAGSPGGPVQVTVHFLVRNETVLRITGITRGLVGKYDGIFRAVTRSFRPLTGELVAEVKETRLRVASARAGESLAALSERTGNEWDVARTAVLNGLPRDAVLAAGQAVKITRSEPYVALSSRRPPASGGPS